MAKKRMFNKDIIESDAFTTMPIQAQMLYVHLSMNADDDGLLNNALAIARAYDIKPRALEILKEKRFLLDLGDGIVCIKHWWINNTLRKDTYKPTAYTEKMATLKIKENGAYTDDCNVFVTAEVETCNVSVTAEGKGCSVDKISKDKVSKGKNNKRFPDFVKEDAPPTDIQAVREQMFGKEQA